MTSSTITHPRLLALLAMAVLAVFALDSVAAKRGLPDWVMNPPRDTTDYIYGVGEGSDLSAARAAAIANIAGTLMTEVDSTTEISQVLDQQGLVEKLRADVNTRVRNTELSGIQIEQTEKIKKTWYALAALPRSQLVNSTMQQLREVDTDITSSLERMQRSSVLEQYLGQAQLTAKLIEAGALVTLLRAANPGFMGREFSERYVSHANYLKDVSKRLIIKVDPDDATDALGRSLVNQLASRNVRASVGKPGEGDSTIRITSDFSDADYGGDLETVMTVRLTTVDEKGQQLASVERKTVGASRTSIETARRQAIGAMSRDSDKQGVFTYLGL